MNEPNNTTPSEPQPEHAPISDSTHLLEPELEPTQPTTASETPVTLLAEQQSPAAEPREHSSGGVLVLQWLSYAFWLWFSISTSVLAGIVINYFVSGSKDYQWGNELAYPLASVIVMLAIALITDRIYAKHEPAKKSGGANVIMLLHVVPFILIAIAALVTVVFSFITMLLNSDPVSGVDGPVKIMLVSLIVASLFALIAARAFYGKNHTIRRITWIAAIVLAVGFIIGAFVGPAADALRTKQDRLVEQALPSLASDIRSYANKNDKLPAKLSDVTHENSDVSDAVQKLIDSKLVTYKANTVSDASKSTYDPGDLKVNTCVSNLTSGACYDSSSNKRYYYQLCTTYTNEKTSEYNYSEDAAFTTSASVGTASDYRYSYLSSISAHPAGQVCYNLYADSGYGYNSVFDATE